MPEPVSCRSPIRSWGRSMEYVVCHEVGHTLGLEHNFKASTAWTTHQLRTPGFVTEHGVAGSIMSYSRFNYVAQPGDTLSHTDMMGRIGPYDKFAIMWGYTPFTSATNPDAERSTLDRWASAQITHPELRFGNYLHSEDPETQSECIGKDAITAAELGMKNVERVSKYLVPAGTVYGDNYDTLRELYSTLVGQRSTEINRIMLYVGGVVETDYHVGHGGPVFKPVSKADQAAAVQFLLNYGTHMPDALTNRWLMSKIYPDGDVARVEGRENRIVAGLLQEQRIQRLMDNEAENGAAAYTVGELAADVQNGVWSELSSSRPTIDVYRRSLQADYLMTIDQRINGAGATRSDLNGIERDNLRKLARKIDRAIPRAGNRSYGKSPSRGSPRDRAHRGRQVPATGGSRCPGSRADLPPGAVRRMRVAGDHHGGRSAKISAKFLAHV